MKANQLKEQKVEKGTNMRKNNAVKMVEVKEGKDDATTVFHPQRFLRPHSGPFRGGRGGLANTAIVWPRNIFSMMVVL